MLRFASLVWFLAGALGLPSCGDPGGPTAAGLAISIGEGGGITGEQGGLRLAGDTGMVYRWQQMPGTNSDEEPAGKLTASQVDAAWAAFAKSGMESESLSQPGNWSTSMSISYEKGGNTTRHSWVWGGGSQNDLTRKAGDLYKELTAILGAAGSPR